MFSILFLLVGTLSTEAQQKDQYFNLDFEDNDNPKTLANDWIQWGNYYLSSDSETVQSGKYSGVIESKDGEGTFGSIAYRIPSRYDGKEIRLEGYMKTEDVLDGHAGLLLRLDGASGSLGFDNMARDNIRGTNDWKKYSITLPYSEKVGKIFVGGILTGKGKVWFDNFVVTIDGVSIQGMPFIEKPKAKAESDTEFDNGSGIELNDISEEDEYKLYTLCKVWGLIKYNHPEVAKGNHNWDYELFRIVPKLQNDDFEKSINAWLHGLGAITDTDSKKMEKSTVVTLADHSWIDNNTLLSDDTKSLLHKVRMCKKPDSHYYISFHVGVGNPDFSNENPYMTMKAEDDGMRLLALFRYWNMIEYYFPYKDLLDEDWDALLEKFIPKMIGAEESIDYKLACLEMIWNIHDTHANIWGRDEELTDWFGLYGAPLGLSFIEGKWVVTRIFPTEDNGDSKISIGDVVTHVNGKDIQLLAEQKAKFSPASNEPTRMRDVARKLLRTNETIMDLTLHNGKESYTEKINVILNSGINHWKKDIPSHKVLGEDIGYIYPATLQKEEIHDIMAKFMDTKALVIDLRCYPADFLVFKLGKYLLPQPTEFAKFTKPIWNIPGSYEFTLPVMNGSYSEQYYKGKIFILINETTQSQAEYTTMALRNAPNATVIGSTTAGADGNVSRIFLPGGINTMISGIGVFYPDGRQTQRIGIVPDLEVHPTIGGIRAGNDELLEKAIKLARQ